MATWLSTMHHLHDRNNATPCTGNNITLFVDNWHNTCDVPASIDHDDYQIVPSYVAPHGPYRRAFLNAWNDNIRALAMGWIARDPLRPDEYTGDAPPTPQAAAPAAASAEPQDPRTLVQMVTQGVTTAMERTTIARGSKQDDTALVQSLCSWKMFLSSEEPKEDGSGMEAFIPELSERFMAIGRIQNKTRRAKEFKSEFNAHVEAMKKERSYISEGVRFHEEQWDTPIVTAIYEAELLGKGLAVCANKIDTHITILQFLPVGENNAEFLRRIQSERLMQEQEQHDEDTRKRGKKETKLFIHGNQRTSYDATATIFNVMAFLKFICDDAESTAVYKCFAKLLDNLRDDVGRSWMNAGVQRFKHFIHTLIVQFHDIFAAFATLATNPIILKRALTEGDMDLQVLKSAMMIGENVINTITTSSSMYQLSVPEPATWKLFSGEEKKRIVDTPDGNKPKRPRNGNNGGPGERQADSPHGKKNEGIFVWTGARDAPLPKCDIKFPNATGKKIFICNNYAFRGRKCGRGRNCQYLHLAKYSDLADDDKPKLRAWVRDTRHVEFAQGMVPTPGTANPPAGAPANGAARAGGAAP
jgi:hypothetical protein